LKLTFSEEISNFNSKLSFSNESYYERNAWRTLTRHSICDQTKDSIIEIKCAKFCLCFWFNTNAVNYKMGDLPGVYNAFPFARIDFYGLFHIKEKKFRNQICINYTYTYTHCIHTFRNNKRSYLMTIFHNLRCLILRGFMNRRCKKIHKLQLGTKIHCSVVYTTRLTFSLFDICICLFQSRF